MADYRNLDRSQSDGSQPALIVVLLVRDIAYNDGMSDLIVTVIDMRLMPEHANWIEILKNEVKQA